MANNLKRGQYQIGNVIFGRNTMFPVETRDVAGYEINAQDYQLDQADEIRMGVDSKKAGVITFTMGYLINEPIENIQVIAGNPEMNFENDPELDDLIAEWDIVKNWGELKPLYVCNRRGETRLVFGRPGRISYRAPNIKAQFIKITAEYRRADTLSYSESEYFHVFPTKATPATVSRNAGSADGFVRFVLTGPMTHPIINFGSQQLELDYEISADEVVEISSYPWARRVVNDESLNLGGYLLGEEPYLDKVKFKSGESRSISWNADSTNSNSKMVFLFRDAWKSMD
jgi:hypothetical protein